MGLAVSFPAAYWSAAHRSPEPFSDFGVGPPARRRSAVATCKKVARKKIARRKAAKRELIDTGTNKLFVRRNREVEDVGRSLAQDRRRKARTVAKRGQGDRGDRQR